MKTDLDIIEPVAEDPAARRLVRSLSTATLLQWLGASAILPMLPVYLRRHGGSDAVVGAVMSAFFVAALVSQLAGGRLTDRLGGRPVLVGGLVLYATASLGFLAPWGPVADIGLRAMQGLGSGAAEVAAFAMIAQAVPLARRGQSFGAVYGGQLAGMAVGPLVGSVAGVSSMSYVFIGAGLGAFIACAPVLLAAPATGELHVTLSTAADGVWPEAGAGEVVARPRPSGAGEVVGRPRPSGAGETVPRPRPSGAGKPGAGASASWSGLRRSDAVSGSHPAPAGVGAGVGPAGVTRSGRRPGWWVNPTIRGVIIAGIAVGLTTGVYESCWTLLLKLRGAQSWEIGLSWTLFAAPFVAVSVPAGKLADRYNRRWLVIGSISLSLGFCATYPFLHDVALLVSLGAVEAAGFATTLPAAQSLLSQASPRGELGRTQGLFSSSQTAATAVAAAVGGSLFAVAAWAPFVFASTAAALLVCSLPIIWRPVQGSVRAGGCRPGEVPAVAVAVVTPPAASGY